MYDGIIFLLTASVVLLTLVIVIFLVVLTVTLLAIKKTLQRLREAIDTVEDTAIRSLSPLLSIRSMLTDFGGFLDTVVKVKDALVGNKRRTKQSKG